MHQVGQVRAGQLFSRALAGIFAGTIFGLIAEVSLFDPPLDRFPIVSPIVGAILLVLFSIAFGGKEITGKWRLLAIGLVAGAVGGVIAGVVVYVPWMMSSHPVDDILREKVEVFYQRQAVCYGLSIGALLGLGIAAALAWRQS